MSEAQVMPSQMQKQPPQQAQAGKKKSLAKFLGGSIQEGALFFKHQDPRNPGHLGSGTGYFPIMNPIDSFNSNFIFDITDFLEHDADKE